MLLAFLAIGGPAGQVPPQPQPNLTRSVMAWMSIIDKTDDVINDETAYFIKNVDAVTTAAPTTHCLSANGTLAEHWIKGASTPQSIYRKLRAGDNSDCC